MSAVIAVLALVLAVGSLGVGVAGLTGALRRNRWAGVRSPETLRSDEAFTVANRVAAPGYLGAGAILAATGVIGLLVGSWGFLFALFGVVVALLVVSAAGSMALQAALAVPTPDAGGCGCCSDSGADRGATGCADDAVSSCHTDTADPAADCGESSCGSCALSGMCLAEDNPHNHAV